MTTTEAALREALEKAGCSQLEATRIISMLSQPSPASSTAGEAEQTAWAWLERRSAEHPNDVTAYGTDDMVDAFMAGAASYQRVLATFANDLEMADFANVGSALNERMCCNGHMCGCQGASVGEYLAHELRSLSPLSGEPASVAGEAETLIAAGFDDYAAHCALKTESDGGFCHAYFYSDGQWRFQTGGHDLTIGKDTVRCVLTKRLYAHPPLSKPTPVEAGLREALRRAVTVSATNCAESGGRKVIVYFDNKGEDWPLFNLLSDLSGLPHKEEATPATITAKDQA